MPHIFASLNCCSDRVISIAAETIETMENTDFFFYPQVLYKKLQILKKFTRLSNFCASKLLFKNILRSAVFAQTGEIHIKAA